MSSERKTRAVLANVPDDDQAARLVQHVRSLAPGLEVIWGSPHVDMTAWCKIKNTSCIWHFTDDHGRDFAPVFGDVIRAFALYRVLIEGQEPRSQLGLLHAARDLYAVALDVQARIGRAFTWDALLRSDWSRAEERLAARVCSSTAYMRARHLTALATFLEGRGVIRQTGYAHRRPRKRTLGVQHTEDRDKAMAKMPPTGLSRPSPTHRGSRPTKRMPFSSR